MSKKTNPVYVKGERNIFCPLYRECLDHARKNHWEFWACHDCDFKKKTKSVNDAVLSSPQNADLYHSISPSLFSKRKEFSI